MHSNYFVKSHLLQSNSVLSINFCSALICTDRQRIDSTSQFCQVCVVCDVVSLTEAILIEHKQKSHEVVFCVMCVMCCLLLGPTWRSTQESQMKLNPLVCSKTCGPKDMSVKRKIFGKSTSLQICCFVLILGKSSRTLKDSF